MSTNIATNTFEDGLNMDDNPLQTKNNRYCNALNATILTFNGNDYCLQNDLGNGRVETAYLPEGYIPMGTTEYGGIIYIVSYNPLTDKCQIGCFPSPERNISSDEVSDKTVSITNESFVKIEGGNMTGDIKTATIKLELLETKLNPGDKYIVYSAKTNGDRSSVFKNRENISDFCLSEFNKGNNYLNTNPRNVKLHLVSIDDQGKVTYLDSDLKWYEYEISSSDKGGYFIGEAAEDSETKKPELDSYRSLVSSEYSIFNSKISGKLCIIAELELITSFSVSWDCELSDNKDDSTCKDVKLFLYPSWDSDNLGSDTIDGTNPAFFFVEESEITGTVEDDHKIEEDKHTVVTKDQIKNNREGTAFSLDFGSFVVKKDNMSSVYYDYTITPCMKYGKIPYLNNSARIDFGLLGTGTIQLSRWKYYINTNNFMLQWGLNAYPEKNKAIRGVEFDFIPYNANFDYKATEDKYYPENNTWQGDCIRYVVNDMPSYAGCFIENIQFNTSSYKIKGIDKYGKDTTTSNVFKPNMLYAVLIRVKYGKTGEIYKEDVSEYKYFTRWLYTCSTLWNTEYLKEKVTDFNGLTLNLDFTTNFEYTIDADVKYYTDVQTVPVDLIFDSSKETDIYQTYGAEEICHKNGTSKIKNVNLNPKLKQNHGIFNVDLSKFSFKNSNGGKKIELYNYTQQSYDGKEFATIEFLENRYNLNKDGNRVILDPYLYKGKEVFKQLEDSFSVDFNDGYKDLTFYYRGIIYWKICARIGDASQRQFTNILAPYVYNDDTLSKQNMSLQTFENKNINTQQLETTTHAKVDVFVGFALWGDSDSHTYSFGTSCICDQKLITTHCEEVHPFFSYDQKTLKRTYNGDIHSLDEPNGFFYLNVVAAFGDQIKSDSASSIFMVGCPGDSGEAYHLAGWNEQFYNQWSHYAIDCRGQNGLNGSDNDAYKYFPYYREQYTAKTKTYYIEVVNTLKEYICTLFLRSDETNFMPVDFFLSTSDQSHQQIRDIYHGNYDFTNYIGQTIGDQMLALYSQMYVVHNDTVTVNKKFIDNFYYISQFREVWTQTMKTAITTDCELYNVLYLNDICIKKIYVDCIEKCLYFLKTNDQTYPYQFNIDKNNITHNIGTKTVENIIQYNNVIKINQDLYNKYLKNLKDVISQFIYKNDGTSKVSDTTYQSGVVYQEDGDNFVKLHDMKLFKKIHNIEKQDNIYKYDYYNNITFDCNMNCDAIYTYNNKLIFGESTIKGGWKFGYQRGFWSDKGEPPRYNGYYNKYYIDKQFRI